SCNNKEGLIWLNGEFVKELDASVSVFDHGLLTGDGVFETLIAYDNNPFAYTRHYRRLERSAKAFNLKVPDINLIRNACVKVLESTSIFPARLRITITGGVAPLGSEKGRSKENVIIASNIAPVQPDFSDVITVSFPRNEYGALSGLKTTSYGENVIALAQAHSMGAKEAMEDVIVAYENSPRAKEAADALKQLDSIQGTQLYETGLFYEKQKQLRSAVIYYEKAIESKSPKITEMAKVRIKNITPQLVSDTTPSLSSSESNSSTVNQQEKKIDTKSISNKEGPSISPPPPNNP
ncbi:aminotransferase class IV, partial [Verrucomicrobiales bacterium]|nr:aminotransferase class IV [Verrucomicrobiales bacterium]